ncbi:MAG: hypothetical protein JSV51_03925 [Candidatus Bathyarchaeota archaeon]|nr:MAG: hypothetical protein JSV51_03925 [Candidatus Bathyarchaeota archaeon]
MKTVQQNYNTNSRTKLEHLLLEAIDEGLSALGDSGKQAIYYHLEKSFKLSKREIPEKIEEFAAAIEHIFGEGAVLLEIHIMQRLHEKAGNGAIFCAKGDQLYFTEYMRERARAST